MSNTDKKPPHHFSNLSLSTRITAQTNPIIQQTINSIQNPKLKINIYNDPIFQDRFEWAPEGKTMRKFNLKKFRVEYGRLPKVKTLRPL